MIAALKRLDREKWADGLACALAISLPWSTSATGILLALWLIVLLPTLNITLVRSAIAKPAGGLPLLLWLLALIGMLWAFDVPMKERLDGLSSFHKLLVIPLLMAQFQRSERGGWIIRGFIASCTVLLVLSWLMLLTWSLPWTFAKGAGIPVKDYIAQSAEFTICAFLLAPLMLDQWRERQQRMALLLALLIAALLANVLFVTPSRTGLVEIPVLALVFALRQLTWKSGLLVLAGGVVVAVLVFVSVPRVRDNVVHVLTEVQSFTPEGKRTRAGERLEYWRKSIGFLAAAPWLGHGTGSIRAQFRNSVAGEGGMAALATTNPHNQTFAVAIQLGLLGTIALFAVWIAHLMIFRADGYAAWAGLAIVTQNIVGSLFNSHLFDFTHGWGYVIGVGVAAGVVLNRKHKA